MKPEVRDRIRLSGVTATRTAAVLLLGGAGLLAPARPVRAQMSTDSGAFVVTLGQDTIAFERYVRAGTRMQIEGISRVPQTRLIRIGISWNDDGSLNRFDIVNGAVPGSGGQAPVHTSFVAAGDSLNVETTEGNNSPRARRMVRVGDVPFVNPFYSTFEVALQRSRATRSKTITMLNQNGPVTYAVSWNGNVAVLSNAEAGTLVVTTDASGRMKSLSGAGTTFKIEVRAASWPADVDGVGIAFAARDAKGGGLGTLSPRDTARAVIAGGVVMVDYGRPATRGRLIFGNVVPLNEVWRTGANAATQFETTKDIVIAGVRVPAGKYTLWTIPSRGPWTLVLNKQIGQWGTVYDETKDLMRVRATSHIVNDPVERLTFKIDPTPTGGIIRLSWDRTEVRIPFTVL
jgi:hypothetical protein